MYILRRFNKRLILDNSLSIPPLSEKIQTSFFAEESTTDKQTAYDAFQLPHPAFTTDTYCLSFA